MFQLLTSILPQIEIKMFPISNKKFNQFISPVRIQYHQDTLLGPSHVRPFH
jgi:hypothetical protein